MDKRITKIGLIVLNGRKLLLVRKRGLAEAILPGGKPKPGETHEECLSREIYEELGVAISADPIRPFGRWIGEAAEPGVEIELITYRANIEGQPRAESEIKELLWIDVGDPVDTPLSPMLKRFVLPAVISHLQANPR